MLKKTLIRAGIGFLIGVLIGNLIAILTGNSEAEGVTFASRKLLLMSGENAALAMLLQSFFSGIYGAVCFAGMSFYDSERLLSAAARLTRIHDALLPYLKKCAEENARCGLPVMRPLFMLAPEEDRAYDHRLYSYLLGPSLLVAPVVEPGAQTRRVWLPEGEWVHLWTGKSYGGGEHTVPAPIGQPPVFRRADCADADLFDKLAQE